MTALELVADLESRGALLAERNGALTIAPRHVLRDADRAALRRHKESVLALLRGRTLRPDWARVTIYDLSRVLEVAVPWSDVRLILAPGCRVARQLRETDPRPGRVWCTCEVLDLLLTGVTPEDARKVAEAKVLMGGAVVGVKGTS